MIAEIVISDQWIDRLEFVVTFLLGIVGGTMLGIMWERDR